jgi:ABC-2 type transport system permease protein
VDFSGLLANPVLPPPVEEPSHPVEFRAFSDKTTAMAALEADEIQAYYILPQDYLTTGNISVVHIKPVRNIARQQFFAFLAANLLSHTNPDITNRILEGTAVIAQSADGSRSILIGGLFNLVLSYIVSSIFLIAMFTAGGYLMEAVVDEKVNRTIEILMTSVSPNQFMAGKIIGDIAIGITQILVWLGFLAAIILPIRELNELLPIFQFPPESLWLIFAIMMPAFVMIAALMATIGATVTEEREAQQMNALFSLPFCIPYMLTGIIIQSPNAPIVVVLSLFPLTAPFTMFIRQGMTIIPVWQVVTSAAILFICATGSIWLAGRAFRLGMLRYGKRLTWREIFTRQGARA